MLISEFIELGRNGIFNVQESDDTKIKLAGAEFSKEDIKAVMCRSGIAVQADIVKALGAIQPIYKAVNDVYKKENAEDTVRVSVRRSEEYGKVVMRAEFNIKQDKYTIISGAKGVSGKYRVYTNGVSSSSEKFSSASKAVQSIM